MYLPMRPGPDGQTGPAVMRVRMQGIGTRRMTPYVNGTALAEGVAMAEGSEFRDYDVAIPAARLRAGENLIQLSFGGSVRVGDEDVAVALSSVRLIPGATVPEGAYLAPTADTLVATVDVGGTERRALAVRAPTTITYHVEVPRGGRLVLGVGAEAAGGHARIVAQTEGGEPVQLYDADVSQRWDDQSIDLAQFAGQVVRLDLIASGTTTGRVAFSVPGIMVAPPQVAEARPVRNVIVLLIDTLRASKLRAYNPRSRVRTPVLDRIAGEGTVFEHAQSQENWTKPSVASVLTGLTSMTHGTKTDAARVPEGAQLISEAFDAADFATGSFIANGYVSDRFGFDQGWDHYTNFIRESRSPKAEHVFREAGDWIEQHREERFFAYVHTIDPHVPYDPPEEFWQMYDPRTDYAGQVRPRMTGDLLERAKRNPPAVTFDESDVRRLTALHDGAISYHDAQFGLFLERLDRLGVLNDTAIVITADHGEEFHEHGSWGHGHSVYQELLSVPFIVWRPGTVPAQRISHMVSTASVTPTVAELAGIPALQAAELPSLVGALRGDVPPGPSVAFSDFLDDRRVIVAGRWKLILRGNNPGTMFDLQADPNEQRELEVHQRPIAGRYLRTMLGQYLGARDRGHWMDAEQREGHRFGTEAAQLDAQTCAQLQALGYLPEGCGATTIGQTD